MFPFQNENAPLIPFILEPRADCSLCASVAPNMNKIDCFLIVLCSGGGQMKYRCNKLFFFLSFRWKQTKASAIPAQLGLDLPGEGVLFSG